MKHFVLLLLAGLLALTCACGGPVQPVSQNPTVSNSGSSVPLTLDPDIPAAVPLAEVALPEPIGFDDYEKRMARWEENRLEDKDYETLRDFAWRFADRLIAQNPEGDFCYSPISLYYALGLAASGAEGRTQQELFDVLGVKDRDILSDLLRQYFLISYEDHELSRFKPANSIWLSSTFEGVPVTYKQDWLDSAAADYFATPFAADFTSPETGRLMGEWITEQTGGQLAPEIPVDPETIFAIINTIDYSDQWIDRFDPADTEEGDFTRADGSVIRVDYLHSEYGSAVFRRGNGYYAAPLQLKESMITFVLPDRDKTLAELLASNSVEELAEGGEHHMGEVVWQIPKFTTVTDVELSPLLLDMGVKEAFKMSADFSGISDHQAWISEIRQGTKISLNEEGIEAASFTLLQYAGAAMPEGRAEMILDRPFLYVITVDGVPAFVGVFGGET